MKQTSWLECRRHGFKKEACESPAHETARCSHQSLQDVLHHRCRPVRVLHVLDKQLKHGLLGILHTQSNSDKPCSMCQIVACRLSRVTDEAHHLSHKGISSKGSACQSSARYCVSLCYTNDTRLRQCCLTSQTSLSPNPCLK